MGTKLQLRELSAGGRLHPHSAHSRTYCSVYSHHRKRTKDECERDSGE